MSDTGSRQLAVGLKYSRTVKVTDEMTPAHLRHEPIRVLSTPDMIRLVEQTAIEAVQPALADGQATVGTRVDIAHLAATPVGMTLTITVELIEIDRRRLGFRIEVRDELDEATAVLGHLPGIGFVLIRHFAYRLPVSSGAT